MKIFKEFKDFAMRGNVVDMAVGIIIGAAFGKIVTSTVNDIIMPAIGLLVGGINFTELQLVLKSATENSPAVAIKYGNFIQVVFDFTIVAFAIFILVKLINAARTKLEKATAREGADSEEAKKPEEAPQPAPEVVLLTEIRDLLKKESN